jgi:hypothetical protein
LLEVNAFDRPCEADELFAREHLAGRRVGAESRSEIERASAETVPDWHGLADRDPDADVKRQCWVRRGFVAEGILKLERCPERTPHRRERDKDLVAASLDEVTTEGLDTFLRDLGKPRSEPGSGLVAVLLREGRVTA